MPIQFLSDDTPFQEPDISDKNGLVAIGGSLSMERLIEAYSKGIFPWYSENEPIMWWSPDPRIVLFPEKIHKSKKMKKLLKANVFSVTVNRDFESVIENCKTRNGKGRDTWITDDMKKAYIDLHKNGYAHSVEVWSNKTLVGGLYGIALGKIFFGESMFFKISNASKYGFIKFAEHLRKQNFILMDGQVDSAHLRSLGSEVIPRSDFLKLLRSGLKEIYSLKSTFPKNI